METNDKIANAVWDKFKVDIVKSNGWYTINSTDYVGHDKVKEINLFIEELSKSDKGTKNPKEASNIFHSIMKVSVSKTATVKQYSQKDADEIRGILLTLHSLSRDEQKKVREDLRKRLNFYISDYTTSKAGFNEKDFDTIVKQGKIRVV